MAVSGDARVVFVSTRPPGESEPWVFGQHAFYSIDDRHPCLYFALNVPTDCEATGTDNEYELTRHDGPARAELYWWKWTPLARRAISEKRRWGYYTLAVRSPCRATVSCYLWPAKIFSFRQVIAMIEETEAELGQKVIWDNAAYANTRAFVAAGRTVGSGMVESFLDDVRQEMRAARSLAERPYREIHHAASPLRGDDSREEPENILVGNWARKRLNDSAIAIARLDAVIGEYKREESRVQANHARVKTLKSRREHANDLLQSLVALSRHLRSFSISHPFLSCSMDLTPAMQRDYRLRRLLRAFHAPLDENLMLDERVLSRLPPLLAPALFELWCVVRLARWTRQLGWQGTAPDITGPAAHGVSGGVLQCSWILRKGLYTLRLDFAPHVNVLDVSDVPELHDRDVSAVEWMAARLGTSGYASVGPLTPDISIVVECDGRGAVAIGDASFVDIEYQDGKKVEIISKYRHAISYLLNGCSVGCHDRGLFATLPGPEPASHAIKTQAARGDVLLLWLTPDQEDANARARYAMLLDTLCLASKSP